MNNQQLEKTYNPKEIEQNWYNIWESKNYFKPSITNGSEKFSIVIPPPNVTGSLHMGHAFQYTIMDIMIRYNRMSGKKTLWQMGTDAAGIATQMVVERQLNQQNIKRTDLSRAEFIDKVWEWKAQSGSTITKQIRRLGASVDWSGERFTMDEGMCNAVNKAFIELYEQGLIYRGERLVNWDPVLHTALSDLEVENIEQAGKLWYIKYPVLNSDNTVNDEYIIIATTRPETLLGDTAVAVNPEDPRYQHFINKKIALPLTDRHIPIIADHYVDKEFGTGAVKITPAHDFNDFEVGSRHNLPILNILTVDAKLNNNVPVKYQNLTREAARKAVLADLEEQQLLVKVQDHTLKVPIGDRSGTVIEPYLVPQWYVKIAPLAKDARETVNNSTIKFVPENYVNMYNSWMNNLQDWCISRQLWWGNRIPAWYDKNKNVYVAISEQAAREKYNLPTHTVLKQEEDTLDTWFAAALWPMASLGWPENTTNLKDFYPTDVLVTGFDIIFFWVARMIMMGLHYNNIPFKTVYFTGLIRDSNGQKMSKSKGNIIDPLDLIDGITLDELLAKRTSNLMQPKVAEKIKQQTIKEFPNGIPAFGTDALRFTLCALASHSRNINFDLKRIEGYRNFCNKLWNATRFVLMNTAGINISANINLTKEFDSLTIADKWILSALQETIANANNYINSYRFDLLAQSLYEFVWDQYCDWYLELSKTTLNNNTNNSLQTNTKLVLLTVLEHILRLLHPITPFITEELWQIINNNSEQSIMLQAYPTASDSCVSANAVAQIQLIKDIILTIRNIRGEMKISPAKIIDKIYIKNTKTSNLKELITDCLGYIKSLTKVQEIIFIDTCVDNNNDYNPTTCATGLTNDLEISIPLAGLIDLTAEKNRLSKEILKLKTEFSKLNDKISNPGFLAKAPAAVVNQEKNKLEEIKNSVEKLEVQYANLDKLD